MNRKDVFQIIEYSWTEAKILTTDKSVERFCADKTGWNRLGFNGIVVTEKHVDALRAGDILAIDTGDFVTFLAMALDNSNRKENDNVGYTGRSESAEGPAGTSPKG